MLKVFYQKCGYFLIGLLGVLGIFHQTLWYFFKTNIVLNGIICSIFFLGVLLILKKATALQQEMHWAIGRREGKLRLNNLYFPDILAVLAGVFPESVQNFPIQSTAFVLETIQNRLEESHRFVRYLSGLLILLGLLGTFWGLLQTIQAISQVIGSLPSHQMSDSLSFFDSLKSGLQQPLSGMGTAFSSSLFGLGASLSLGFLDTQLNQLHQDFYKDIEEWLTSLNTVSELTVSPQVSENYLSGVVGQLTTYLQNTRLTLDKQLDLQQQFVKNTLNLTEKLSFLSDVIKTEQSLMLKIAEHQIELQTVFKHLHHELTGPTRNHYELLQSHLRTIESHLVHISDGLNQNQLRALQDISTEMRLLNKLLTAPSS